MRTKLLAISLLLLFSFVTLSAQNTIYLSPEGDDAKGDGSQQRPYYSLCKAFSSPEANIATTDTLFVEVAAGDYFMQRTLSLTKANLRPIVVRSADEQKPRLMGGKRISGWEHWRDGIYRAYIPEVELYGYSFEQFYVNGKRATLARTPNEGFFNVVEARETVFEPGHTIPHYSMQQIILKAEDIKALDGIELSQYECPKVRFYHKWDNTTKPISNIWVGENSIFYDGYGAIPWNSINSNTRCFIYDYMEALDVEGEWFLDKDSGYIYYYPLKGEDMSQAECIAPTLRRWIEFKGDIDNLVHDISFRNISFQYNSYKMPLLGNDPMQAAAAVEAAIEMDYVKNISFLDCEMMHTGGYGVWVRHACYDNTIDHCYLYDLGAGGIKVGSLSMPTEQEPATSGNVINNSIITSGGQVFPCGVGVSIFFAAHNRVTHNEISDMRYSGVSVGWVWGYAESPSVDNLIAYNHIHHIGWGELSDMGAVYTLGVSPGTKVVHNHIHDVVSYDYGGWGLYTDEGSTGIEMTHNLVYRCKCGAFHQHYGKENKIENNIFALGYVHTTQMSVPEEHISFSFKHNIILHNQGATMAGNWDTAKIAFGYNIYWSLTDNAALSFADMSFEEWKHKHEADALNINPQFVNPLEGDFRFRSLRAARKIGFEVFDYTEAGVYGSDGWRAKAQMPKELIEAFDKAAEQVKTHL